MQSLPCLFFGIRIIWGKSIFLIPNVYNANWSLLAQFPPPDRKLRKEENGEGKEKQRSKGYTDDCKYQRKILPAPKCFLVLPLSTVPLRTLETLNIIVCIFRWDVEVTEVMGQRSRCQPVVESGRNSCLLAHCTEAAALIRAFAVIHPEPSRLPQLSDSIKQAKEHSQRSGSFQDSTLLLLPITTPPLKPESQATPKVTGHPSTSFQWENHPPPYGRPQTQPEENSKIICDLYGTCRYRKMSLVR